MMRPGAGIELATYTTAAIGSSELADLICAVTFGVLGYLMKRHDWPRIPLVMALALAPLFENSLHLTLRLHELGRIDFWSRPVVIGLLILTLFNMVLPAFLKQLRALRKREI